MYVFGTCGFVAAFMIFTHTATTATTATSTATTKTSFPFRKYKNVAKLQHYLLPFVAVAAISDLVLSIIDRLGGGSDVCVCVCASAYLQQQEQECLLCGLNIFQEETKISGKADNCWEMGVFNHAVFMFVLHFLLLRSISGRMLLLPITEVVQFLISLNLQNLSGQKKYCRKMTIRNAKTSWICVLERSEIKIYRVDLKPIY